MKLFTKTSLFFISVILFQSSLTILLITNITKRSNQEDALKELKNEATIVFDNYNSWKRGIWKTLIELQHNQAIAAIVQDYQSAAFQQTLTNYFKQLLMVSGIDLFVVRHSAHAETDIVPITYNNFSLAELQQIENTKPHAYIDLRFIGSQLCLIGITRFDFGAETNRRHLDLFLIKRIDRDFCRQLILNRSVHVLFFLDNRYLIGTLDQETLSETSGLTKFETTYYEVYDIEIEQAGYNIAVQKLERFQSGNDEHKLFLVTILSNAPYIGRLTVLERTVLTVTVLSALLTILLSLFLSRNITRPIRNLLAGMQSIRGGKYDTTIETQARNEIGELFQGFNEMARQIHQDKEKMEAYIHEITFLKDYHEQIIHSIGAAILIVNRHLKVEKVNPAFLEDFHLDEQQVLGANLRELRLAILDDTILNDVQAILQKTKDDASQIKRVPQNKVYEIKLYPIENPDATGAETNEAVGCVFVIEDISRKVEFEEKIFQAEKLSSISMLSAGVAHEINNPLSSIMTNVQNLIEDEQNQERQVALNWIEQETKRIAKIVQELLNFSSSNLDSHQGVDVNRNITETINLITYSLKKKAITITTELEDELPLAVIGQDEFKQIIINLVKNSIQAIAQTGEIAIKTSKNVSDRTILVTIEDTGNGIKGENLSRIFDPFYTTKQNGEGTGLGLSIVYGIMNKYKGAIKVSSTEGKGTKMILVIPMLKNQ